MTRHSVTQVHATGVPRNPTVLLTHHPDDLFVVTVHADLVSFEAFEGTRQVATVTGQTHPTVHLYLTVEQAVTMATDILAQSMGVRPTLPPEIRRTA